MVWNFDLLVQVEPNDLKFESWYRKYLKIGTPEIVIVLKMDLVVYTM